MSRRERGAAVGEVVAGPWALPAGWRWERLGNIATIIAGQSPASANCNKGGVGLPFFQGKGEFGSLRPTPRQWCADPPKVAFKDDVLISVRAPVGPTNLADEQCGIGRGLAAIRTRDGEHEWLRHWLACSVGMLLEHATGTTFEAITGEILRNHLVPVTDLVTKQNVIGRITGHFADIDDGEAALARARADLEVYRRALLKAAVTGELTADWRAANPARETGAELLARILADRRARWHADQKHKGKQYVDPDQPISGPRPEIPDRWTWSSLDALIEGDIQNGLYLPQSAYGSGASIMRIDDFQSGLARDSAALRRVNAPAESIAAYSLYPGDIVVNRVNSPSHLGKSFLVRPANTPALFESNMMRLRPTKLIYADFLELYLTSPIGRMQLSRNAKMAVNQASINQADVRCVAVPLPSLDEQKKIVEMHEWNGRLELSSVLDEQTKGSNLLRQSILAAAFRGDLT